MGTVFSFVFVFRFAKEFMGTFNGVTVLEPDKGEEVGGFEGANGLIAGFFFWANVIIPTPVSVSITDISTSVLLVQDLSFTKVCF